MTLPRTLAPDKILFLATGLTSSFLVNLSAQFPSANIADVQGGILSTPDEASWILTSYTMASLVGIVTSGVFIKTLGIGRYLLANATAFAITALLCATAPDLSVMIVLRVIQGFSAGGFNPAAFVAVFMVAGGPRLPLGLTLLAFVLLFPVSVGPIISGFVEDSFSWQALFLTQAAIGAILALVARAWAPNQDPDWSALNTDWMAIFLLSLALATLTLVLSQGTRRFWFENDMIVWCTAISIGAFAGFVFLVRFSPLPIISPRLLLDRKFSISIGLNLVFRFSLVVTSYLMPHFLATVQDYRPLEIAELLLWAAIPQLLTLPVAWRLMYVIDTRWLMGMGLLLCAIGTALVIDGTSLVAAEQFHLPLVIFSVGQLLFLIPAIVAGASSLKPLDFPTASLAFNISTIGGTTLGVGMISSFISEREQFHSNIITEKFSLYRVHDVDRVTDLIGIFTNQLVDDADATLRSILHLASTARREAWILAFNDGFLAVAALLGVSAIAVLAFGPSPPLPSRDTTVAKAIS